MQVVLKAVSKPVVAPIDLVSRDAIPGSPANYIAVAKNSETLESVGNFGAHLRKLAWVERATNEAFRRFRKTKRYSLSVRTRVRLFGRCARGTTATHQS